METHERDLEGKSLRRQFEAADQESDRAAKRVIDTADGDHAAHKLAQAALEQANKRRDDLQQQLNRSETGPLQPQRGPADDWDLGHNASEYARLKARLAAQEIEGAPATGSALREDWQHRAAFYMRDRAPEGQHYTIVGGDGVPVNLTQVEHSAEHSEHPESDPDGIAEWIVDERGNLTHERFIPGGRRTGFSNQRPGKLGT